MIRSDAAGYATGGWWLALCSLTVAGFLAAAPAQSAPPEEPAALPDPLSLDLAILWALEHNPELAAIREQHGIAAAAVVIAETYPFNPIWEAKIRAVNGPESAGITNRVSNEHKIFIEWEVRHQGRYRREGAAQALSRTDYEIAFQELGVTTRVLRAFYAAIYREQKLAFVERTIKLNDGVAKEIAFLVEQNQLRGADLIVARTEVDDTRTQLGSARAALVVARNDLRRLLGLVDEPVRLQGSLATALPPLEEADLAAAALERRPDRSARLAAVGEAEARIKLAQVDRYGNPVVGPAYEYDPSRINLIGAQFALPLPVFNRHRGEIMQREAEHGRAVADLHQTEIQVRQDVQEAIARLRQAKAWADSYTQAIKNLNTAHDQMKQLFLKNEPGADLLRVIDIRRKLLKAQENYLDSLWELSQARADLAAAVADPRLACLVEARAEAKQPAPPE